MINHGLSTGALFLVIGMIYDRYHTRDINQLSGLAREMPMLAFFFVLFTLSSIGLPGLERVCQRVPDDPGRVHLEAPGDRLRRDRRIGHHPGRGLHAAHGGPRDLWAAQVAAAWRRPRTCEHAGQDRPGDIDGREIALLTPLAIAVVLLGVLPNIVLTTIEAPVSMILEAVRPPQAVVTTQEPSHHGLEGARPVAIVAESR